MRTARRPSLSMSKPTTMQLIGAENEQREPEMQRKLFYYNGKHVGTYKSSTAESCYRKINYTWKPRFLRNFWSYAIWERGVKILNFILKRLNRRPQV